MKLKLGPIPDSTLTKVTISIPAPLKEQLDRYAKIHSESFGTPVDAPTLIPLIVARFLAKDRVFQREMRKVKEG